MIMTERGAEHRPEPVRIMAAAAGGRRGEGNCVEPGGEARLRSGWSALKPAWRAAGSAAGGSAAAGSAAAGRLGAPPMPEGDVVDGDRSQITSADGTPIGLLSAGDGPALLLVHGGMGRLERWEPLWGLLTKWRRVTAMDRRGRASSGDTPPYRLGKEFDDVAAVAASLAAAEGSPVDVFAHSIGATVTVGAAAQGAPLRRVALYEPPGPQTVAGPWRERAVAQIEAGQPGPAMLTFLTEVVGLSREQIEGLRGQPGAQDVLPIVSATLPREAEGLAGVDLPALAAAITAPVLLMLGTASPPWAGNITRALAAVLPDATLAELPGYGHEAVDTAPALVDARLQEFLR
jgi:pimeloyl-ACP methyl ester carboxylesterase